MKTRCCYPKRYLLLFFSLLVSVGSILMSVSLSSCSSSVKSPLLLSADSLMEIYPDSALSILESISSPQKLPRADRALYGSVVILGGLSLVNSLHAYTFASLKRKKLISTTPLNDALNALILALNASAAAFVLLFTKKFRILS